MSSFYPPKLEPRHPTTTLAGDVPCRKCHGNLRGLSCDAHCPGCGAAVSLSLRGDLIRYSNPAWIDKLRFGLTLSVWGTIITIPGAAAAAHPGGIPMINPMIPIGIAAFGILMDVLGTWLFTAPDPCNRGENRYGAVRKSIRFLLILNILFVGLLLCEYLKLLPVTHPRIMMLVRLARELTGFASVLMVLNYLSKLALRIRDTTLSDRAKFLALPIGISTGILIVCQILIVPEFLIAPHIDEDFFEPVIYVAALAGLVGSIFLIANLILFRKFALRLKQQAALARQEWETAPKSVGVSE